MELVTPISEAHLERIRRCAEVSTYQAGQVIFYEGHQPTGFYALLSGKIALKHINGEGREDIAEIVSPCRAIGIHHLLKDQAYPLTAQAVENCEIAFVGKTTFMEWMNVKHSLIEEIVGKEPVSPHSDLDQWVKAQNLLTWFKRQGSLAILALFLMVALGSYLHQTRRPEFPLQAAVIDDHAPFISGEAKPEISTKNPAEIAAWFRDKLDVPIQHPFLFGALQFMGARLCWFKGKNPVAYLMGSWQGHPISMFAFNKGHFRFPKGQKIKLLKKKYRVASAENFNAVLWERGNTAYVLLSDIGPAALLSLASGGNGS